MIVSHFAMKVKRDFAICDIIHIYFTNCDMQKVLVRFSLNLLYHQMCPLNRTLPAVFTIS